MTLIVGVVVVVVVVVLVVVGVGVVDAVVAVVVVIVVVVLEEEDAAFYFLFEAQAKYSFGWMFFSDCLFRLEDNQFYGIFVLKQYYIIFFFKWMFRFHHSLKHKRKLFNTWKPVYNVVKINGELFF